MRRLRALLGRTTRDKDVSTGFSSLPEELIQEILRYLRWPTDYYVLSLVCRKLHRHATAELYAILVVAYHRPARINALLELLETNPGRAAHVSTLLFDEDVKSIGPNLHTRARQASAYRRDLTDGWDPASPDLQSVESYPQTSYHVLIAKRLRVVLPTLRNLQSVVMRSLHPTFMYPGVFGDVLRPDTPSIINDFPVEVEVSRINQDGGIWRYIFGRTHSMTSIYVNGTLGGQLEDVAISSLTTVSISDIFHGVDYHVDAAHLWNSILAHASNLNALAMAKVEYAYIILRGLFFPNLEALELYIVYLGAPHEYNSMEFINFLYSHSSTLQILAISCPMWGTIDHTGWLSDNLILPKLHTLRLNHTMALLTTNDELLGLPNSAETFDEMQEQKLEIIFDFIRNRPNILDVGIASVNRHRADEFARFLAQTRRMRNVFIGEAAEQTLSSHAYRAHRSWDYSSDAWAFYNLFGGLTITKSGYRPRLPLQTWKFWQKPIA